MNKCRFWNMCCLCYQNQCDSKGQVVHPLGGGDTVQEMCMCYQPMPDVKALMTLADEFDSVHMHKAANRVRDALGVANG